VQPAWQAIYIQCKYAGNNPLLASICRNTAKAARIPCHMNPGYAKVQQAAAVADAIAESNLAPTAVGDDGHSIGLF
jgi:hypothetical protein